MSLRYIRMIFMGLFAFVASGFKSEAAKLENRAMETAARGDGHGDGHRGSGNSCDC